MYVSEIGEDLASLADALSVQAEQVEGLTLAITAQSGQHLICDLSQTTSMVSASAAISSDLAALLITALDLWDGSDLDASKH